MIRDTSPKEIVKSLRETLRATETTRMKRREYVMRNRCRYLGIQWMQQQQMPSGFTAYYSPSPNQSWFDAARTRAPLRTTLNKTTMAVVQKAASTSWADLAVSTVPPEGDQDAVDMARADIMESVANTIIRGSRLVGSAQTAGFERYIDGMKGVGGRIRRFTLPGGVPDAELESFDFECFQLSLDPTIRSRDLEEHHEVVLHEVKTWEAAKRQYGDEALAGIKESSLRSVANLLPMETTFHALSHGAMYQHLNDCLHDKAVIVHTIFKKGVRDRFDRMYVVLDAGREAMPKSDGAGPADADGMRVLNPDGRNPYGGTGMPLGLKCGDRRPGEAFCISLVGHLTDAQTKINSIESLYWQQVYDFTTGNVTYLERGWLGNDKALTDEEIREKIASGLLIGNPRPRDQFKPPSIINRPPPHAQLAQDSYRYSAELQEAAGQTALHRGQVKTHVPDTTNQTALELVEMPEDDRREADARVMERVITVMSATAVRLVHAGAPSMVDLLTRKARLTDEALGILLDTNPDDPGVEFKINPESIRRRSQAQMVRDFERIAQWGGHENPVVRAALASMDYPLLEEDRDVGRWARKEVAMVLQGRPYRAAPAGEMAFVVFKEIQRAMRSARARDPEIMMALEVAYQQQMEVEQAYSGLPMDAEAPVEEELPPVPMDQLFGGVRLRA